MTDDMESAGSHSGKKTIAAVVVVMLVVVCGVTMLLGIGPFGYRIFKYGMVKIHVYNGTPHFALVDIEGVDKEIPPFEGRTVEVVGGELEMSTVLQLVKENEEGIPERTDELRPLETQSFVADDENFLYHVATEESACVAIVDMTSFYRKGATKDPRLVGTVPKDRRLQVLDTETVFYSQSVLPDQLLEPPMLWLPSVACSMLSDPAKLLMTVKIRAVERRKALEKELMMREKLEELQRMQLERERESQQNAE